MSRPLTCIDVCVPVFLKYKLRELRCPRDLQEADFLDLLRSTFPELAAEKHFDVLVTDRNRELQQLSVEALTPAEIHRAVSLTRSTTLFIRLKVPCDLGLSATLITWCFSGNV